MVGYNINNVNNHEQNVVANVSMFLNWLEYVEYYTIILIVCVNRLWGLYRLRCINLFDLTSCFY